MSEPEYVLGTHDDELARLGVQHRIWRDRMLHLCRHAGFGPGSRLVDLGCGPGFATIDLADLVGVTGSVIAVDQSLRFLAALRAAAAERGLRNIETREANLESWELPASNVDGIWCRWVAAFVSSPEASGREGASCAEGRRDVRDPGIPAVRHLAAIATVSGL